MDLTKEYPRSVHEKFAGVVMLGRATDKAKAKAAGTNGEYNYECPMDKAVFGFLGINADEYLAKVKSAANDGEIEAYAREFVSKKTPAEIEEFNSHFVQYKPEAGSEGEKYFLEIRNAAAPHRTDVTAWADLLDLDEKRAVPERVPA